VALHKAVEREIAARRRRPLVLQEDQKAGTFLWGIPDKNLLRQNLNL
jgi:hypothetical protein